MDSRPRWDQLYEHPSTILPQYHVPNAASRILSLCEKRLPTDWQERFGHPLVLVETFVDPQRFHGTVYRASNWLLCAAAHKCHYVTSAVMWRRKKISINFNGIFFLYVT
jgi:hypothetical protein